MLSEKDKMLSGEDYFASTKELESMRKTSQTLWAQYNTTGDITLLEKLFKQQLANVTINPPFHCDYGETIKFGKKVFINYNCTFLSCGGIEIGDNTFIGPHVQIYTAIHPLDPKDRNTGIGRTKKVKIGANCWLGGGVIILPGVEIGEGSTIGAGSVVTKNIPPGIIAWGNPCKVMKKITQE